MKKRIFRIGFQEMKHHCPSGLVILWLVATITLPHALEGGCISSLARESCVLGPQHVLQSSRVVWPGGLRLRGGEQSTVDEVAVLTEQRESTPKREYDPEEGTRFLDDGDEMVDDGLVDYAKFSMTKPVRAEGVDLNAEYTGKSGEVDWLVRDAYIGRWGWTALHRAAIQGDVGMLERMLDMGGDPNSHTKNGWHVVHEAAAWGQLDCLRLLVARGANASALNRNGWSCLHFAAANGQTETVQYLLDLGLDKDWQDNYGDTALDKVTRHIEARFPCVPPGRSIELTRYRGIMCACKRTRSCILTGKQCLFC